MRARWPLAVASLALGAGALTATDLTRAASAGPCERPRIGFLGPLTGEAAFIGKEQLGFARYAVRHFGGSTVRLVEVDTRLDPVRAKRAARTLHGNPDVLAVVGPAGSREVLAVAPVFSRTARLPFVSASAVQTALTNGSIPGFFRVVPKASAQAPAIAGYIRRDLEAKSVVVVDDRTGYSRPLAAAVQARLRARGVTVTRRSVDQKVTEFSTLVAGIGEDVDVVFLPWQIAANAQAFGEQLRAGGRDAIVFGSDAVDSGDFVLPGSYVAAFAPDIRAIEGNAAFVSGYGRPFVSNFGPPAYVATQAAIAAVRKACADRQATRAEVERHLRATFVRRTILGRSLRFTARGDAAGATFSIFRLGASGKRTLVR